LERELKLEDGKNDETHLPAPASFGESRNIRKGTARTK
jgi:hypothetical protein